MFHSEFSKFTILLLHSITSASHKHVVYSCRYEDAKPIANYLPVGRLQIDTKLAVVVVTNKLLEQQTLAQRIR